MPIPEWYSGTDLTGRVAAGVEAVIERMDARTADNDDIATLQALLELEQETNWRCFLLGLVGTIQYDLEETEKATRILQDSVAGYKVYLDTFDEVLSVYCQSCYTLGVIHFEAKRYAEATPYFLRCLPYMHEVYDETYIGNILAFLDLCFQGTNQNEAALVFSEAAAYTRHGDCESLEQLMISYTNAGEIEKATDVFHLLQNHCTDYDDYSRVLEFAESHLGESGVVN